MTITELRQVIEEAQVFAKEAVPLMGETTRAEAAGVLAQISMAKSLAVIAEILIKQYALKIESDE